jgi:aryl-alcohol dehydrogenase-like predicted oxidoreductase
MATDRRGFVQGALAGVAATRWLGAAEPAKRVDHHPLGATGREVSIYGLGLGSVFVGAYRDNPEGAGATLKRAVEVWGVDYWDTSEDYAAKNKAGKTVFSEELVGGVLAAVRAKVFLSSKTNARTYDGFKRALEASLKRLRTDRLDLYNLHCLTPKTKIDALETGAIKAARELKEQGVIKHWGVTSHLGAAILIDVVKRCAPDVVTAPFPAGRPDGGKAEDELLPLAVERKVGVVAMKPLRGTRGSQLKPTELLRYGLSLPGMGVVLVGQDTVAHLDENARVATDFRPLDKPQRAALSAQVRLALSPEEMQPWLSAGYRDGLVV